MSVELSNPHLGLRRAILTYLRMKLHAIVLDSAINEKETVVESLFHLCVVAAMRTYVYLNKLRALFVHIDPRLGYSIYSQNGVDSISTYKKIHHIIYYIFIIIIIPSNNK